MPSRPPIYKSLQPPRQPWQHPRGKESAASRGYGRDWAAIRTIVLAQEPFCRYCLAEGIPTRSTTVDHMRPKSQGGGNDRGNLCGCCDRHQRAKAAREGAQARRDEQAATK